jgi:hypothetical protein
MPAGLLIMRGCFEKNVKIIINRIAEEVFGIQFSAAANNKYRLSNPVNYSSTMRLLILSICACLFTSRRFLAVSVKY